MLAREIPDLPAQHWMPLAEALAVVRQAVGSNDLAARDLTARARAGEIAIAVRELRGDGDMHMVLAPEFWNVSEIVAPIPGIFEQPRVRTRSTGR
jgi:hypothetical protein